MFQSLIETRAEAAPRSLGSFGFAFGLHAMVLAAVVVTSYLIVGKITPPDIGTTTIWIVNPPPPVSGGKSGGAVAVKPQGERKPATAIQKPKELEQPTALPDPAPPDPSPAIDAPTVEGPISDAIGPGTGSGGTGDGKGTGKGTGDGTGDGPGVPGSTGDSEGPIFVDATVAKPELLLRVQPKYPETARLARIPGTVLVQAVISATGAVESVEVISSTNPIFNAAAQDAVRKWRYRPAMQNGRPVAVYFTVEVRFLLQ
jgi:protein TonB